MQNIQDTKNSETLIFGNAKITRNKKPLMIGSFTKSGILSIADIWDNNKNNFINDTVLHRKLLVKRNWISEWTLVKTCVKQFLKTDQSKQHVKSCNIRLNKNKLFNYEGKEVKYN